MSRQRRFLPSISQLTAFETVLRTGTTTAAARELQLSQAAVSRLVQTLEAQIGHPLFIRQRKRLVPTEAALTYGRDIGSALDIIQRSSMRIAANLGGGSLSLAILPAFGTRWLAPRLGRFLAAHPGITINLATRIRPFDFSAEPFDAAIYFGTGTWPDAGHLKLFDERVTACIAPRLLESHPINRPADLAGLQLFQIETRPQAWATWFAAQEAEPLPVTGMLFDQFAPIMEATIAGLGVGLLPEYLAETEIAAGRLVPLLTPSVSGTGSYWLAWPASRETHRPLQAFKEWLAGEVGT